MTKSIDLEPTLEDAFGLGQKEGLKEAFIEIKQMLDEGVPLKALDAYVRARLVTIQNFDKPNPFKRDSK